MAAPVTQTTRFRNLPTEFDEHVPAFIDELEKGAGCFSVLKGYVAEEERGKEYVAILGWDECRNS
jgi:hypothetical protein